MECVGVRSAVDPVAESQSMAGLLESRLAGLNRPLKSWTPPGPIRQQYRKDLSTPVRVCHLGLFRRLEQRNARLRGLPDPRDGQGASPVGPGRFAFGGEHRPTRGPASAMRSVALTGWARCSAPSSITRRVSLFLTASRLAPRQMNVTSSPARASLTTSIPPIAPAPTMQRFMDYSGSVVHSVPRAPSGASIGRFAQH